jgi:hypothetical protein
MTRQPGLDQRHRDNDGWIRVKNGNTRIGTLRQSYGETFAPGRRTDMHLDNFLDDIGSPSLTDYLKNRDRYDR